MSCPDCYGSGFITWEQDAKRYWSPCGCEAGQALTAELDTGIAQIRAGRLHKWADIKRAMKRRHD